MGRDALLKEVRVLRALVKKKFISTCYRIWPNPVTQLILNFGSPHWHVLSDLAESSNAADLEPRIAPSAGVIGFGRSTLGKQEAGVKKNEATCTTCPMCVQSLARNSWLEKQFLFSRLHVQKSRLHMQSYLTARNWEKSASRAEEDILHVLPSASC